MELNATFYRLPQKKTFSNWRDRTPEDFLFAVKGSRLITHLRRLRGAEDVLKNFLERVDDLGNKLGPLLFQLLPGLHKNVPLLEQFLTQLPSRYACVVEFRHSSWYDLEVYELLRSRNVTFCIHDMRGFEAP